MSEQQQQQEYDTYIRDVLASAQYRDPERTRQDLLEVLVQYPGLKPVTETHVFNNGAEQLLLALAGTIPIHHKGHLYYIPVFIWLLNTYPYNAPMVFVKPTPDMRIKVSEYVAPDGKVSLPYLQEWNHEQPPVYSVLTSPPPLPYPTSPSSSLYNPYQQAAQPISPHRAGLLRTAEEKLVLQLLKSYQSTEVEKQTADQLRRGSEKLTTMLKRVEQEKEILEQDVHKCQTEIESVGETLTAHESEVDKREQTVIEDAILAPRPLYNQIVMSYAEDQALEDAIYYVSEGLRSGKMELDQFEKSIRKLARKQFMLRLLIIKCRQKAGLP